MTKLGIKWPEINWYVGKELTKPKTEMAPCQTRESWKKLRRCFDVRRWLCAILAKVELSSSSEKIRTVGSRLSVCVRVCICASSAVWDSLSLSRSRSLSLSHTHSTQTYISSNKWKRKEADYIFILEHCCFSLLHKTYGAYMTRLSP